VGRLDDECFVTAVQRLAVDGMHIVVAEARLFAAGRMHDVENDCLVAAHY
jgi:hypothetical protein